MFEFILKQLKKNKKGFTLVELVVVIAILGILAAIAVPKLGASRQTAAKTVHEANIKVLTSAATMYIADKGVPSTENVVWAPGGGTKSSEFTIDEETESKNMWANYLQEWPKAPTGLKIEDSDVDINEKDYVVTIDTDGNITVTNEEREE